jgi:predicted Fe-S protein YdhL (DUF1289 family)
MASPEFPSHSIQASVETADAIASPCIGVCTLGPGDICIGCLRTSAEIGMWLNFSNQQRRLILAELPQRMEILFGR